MNLSMRWLDEFVHVDTPIHDFCEALTMSGSKVEGYEVEGAEIENVVVGKVLAMERHPNSDHMWICQVDVGKSEPVQIVTGAQNVHVGDLVPAALHKSHLPGGVTITKGKLRGVESNGMLCSLKELGLTTHDFPYAIEDGIFILQEACAVGEDIRTAIGLNDTVVEFEITSNRPDCLSIIGLARETAATYRLPLHLHTPVVQGAGGDVNDLLKVRVENTELCQRYMAAVVRNIKVASSPRWLRERLRACGVRPINNIVDITNYVMVEYGQPMHAFDYRYVKGGKIVVRRAGEDKTLTTLDGNVRNLQPDMLVIADETKPVGLAGVMGGENSEIVDDTVDVVFESANFLGSSIRKTALALGMRTDASAKFEKDIDPMLTVPAVNRACELVEMLGAGEVMDGMIDVLNYVPQPVTVKLEPERINALLGTDIPEADMIEYLRREEVPVVDGMIQVPSWRPDLRVMADIAEEVARYYGYNNIETTLMRGATTMGGYSDAQKLENAAGAAARAMGYSEIITYSFVSPASFDAIRIPADSPLRRTVKLVNPLGEDTSIMRTVILPSMLDILSRNFAFKNKGVKLYEIGKIYLPKDGEKLPDEPKRMIFGTYGEHENFFTLKGEIDAILDQLNVHPATYIADTKNPSYHPGRCADIVIDGKKMGVIGQIHPLVAETYGIGGEVYVAELDFTGLQAVLAPERVFHSLPKFPTVSRDLALVCEESMTVGMLEACIKKAGGKLLRSVQLFDIYRGPGIAPGKKSIAFSLELRADDRTLTDEDTTGVMNAVLEKLKNDLGVSLR